MKPMVPLQFPLQGTSLIEASAGTGKTYTLAALYVRLVLGQGGDLAFPKALLPPEILVVTFTNAATLELRDRIRQNLAKSAEVFRGAESKDQFTLDLLAQYPDVKARESAAIRLERAADWMDEAAIYTIHGWAQRVLTMFAFDSNSAFNQTLADSENDILDEAARDYWRIHCSQLPAAVAEQIGSVLISPAKLQGWAKKLVGRDLGLCWQGTEIDTGRAPTALKTAIEQWLASCQDVERKLLLTWSECGSAVVEELNQTLEAGRFNGTRVKAAKLAESIAAMNLWLEDGVSVPAQSVIEYLIFDQSKMKKGQEAPVHAADSLMRAYLDIRANRPNLAPVVGHALGWIVERFESLKSQVGLLDFNDLLLKLRAGLRGKRGAQLAQRIRDLYPVAMIDEFQDTDAVQFEIFNRVYGVGNNHSESPYAWLMIGDPKQAIYSFRGADIHTYLAARKQVKDSLYTLDTNYRSSESVVTAVNCLFEHADTKSQGAFLFSQPDEVSPLPFTPIKAKGLEQGVTIEGDPLQGLRLMHLDLSEETSADQYREQLAKYTAERIASLLARSSESELLVGDKPLIASDIAVLVRSGREAAAVRTALNELSIGSVYLSDKESIYQSNEALDLWRILQAVANPRSQALVVSALASPVLGMDRNWLAQLRDDETAWEVEAQRFIELQILWRRTNIAALVQRLISEFNLPQRLRSRLGDAAERTLTNLLHLGEILQRHSQSLDGELGLIRHLGEMIKQPQGVSEEQLVRMESDAGRVQVITLHKSKGLEYPLVFIPYGVSARKASIGDDGLIFREGERAQLELLNSQTSSKVKEEKEAADLERLQEDIRLLYVGLTRAKYCCWLGVANIRGVADSAFASLMSVSGKGEALAESLQNAIEKLNQSEAIALEAVDESSAPVKKIAVTETPLIPARQLERAVVQDRWWVTSYSAIASRVESSQSSDAFDESLALTLASEQDNGTPINSAINEFEQAKAGTIHAFERGAVPGNFLHELLESAALYGFEKVSQDSTLLETLLPLESLPERWQAERGMLLNWLQATLVADLQLGSNSQLRSLQLYQPEMEFLFAAHEVDLEQLDALCHQAINPELQRPKLKHEQVNGMLKGFIDLTFVDKEQYWVCDYKSNWLGPDVHSYDLQAMSPALVEHRYDLQLMIYLLALHRMLLARDSEYRANPALGYETRVGGALYVYLRGFPEGAGVLKNKPDYQFVEQMDRLFRGEC